MKTTAWIVLVIVFGNVTCATRIKPMRISLKVHKNKNNVVKNNDYVKTMPNLIDVDYNHTLNNFHFRANDNELKFTDFILEAAMILKTYDNDLLKQVFDVVDDELGKTVYNGCKSHELVKLKGYLSDSLGVLKDTSPEVLRNHLNNMINIVKKEDYGDLAETVDLVNSFYVGENDKFIKVLLALMFKKINPRIDLNDIVRRALRYLFFDHYCHLNAKIRRELILTIEHYWKQFVNLRVNNKIERKPLQVTFVTPFDYVKRIKKINKKRRFNTVRERRPGPRNKTTHEYDKSVSNEHITEPSTQNYKPVHSSEDSLDYLERVVPDIDLLKLRSSKSESKLDLGKNQNIPSDFDENIDYENQIIKDNETYELEDKVTLPPTNILRQPDLEKLQNIKALAEEINGLISAEEKAVTKPALEAGSDVTNEDMNEMILPNITINLRRRNNKIVKQVKIGAYATELNDHTSSKLKIGTDAKEINDATSSNQKIARKRGEVDLPALLYKLPLQFDHGDIRIIPQMPK